MGESLVCTRLSQKQQRPGTRGEALAYDTQPVSIRYILS